MTRSLLVLAMVAAAAAFATSTAYGASYTVGEPRGSWDLQTNYTAWASSISFHRGDQLVFRYSPTAHDVVEVTENGYLSCSTSRNITVFRTGEDTVQLDRLGRRHFICGVQRHCAAGMKVQVRVVLPGCNSSSPVVNGTPEVNGAPGGICIDGSTPTTIISTPSYSSPGSPGGAASSVFPMAAAVLLLGLSLMV